jgi:hypothetical protein
VVFVFSSDINEKRKHIHVRDKRGRITNLCKFWLEPRIELDYSNGFNKAEINKIGKLIKENRKIIIEQLEKFYAGKKVKSVSL